MKQILISWACIAFVSCSNENDAKQNHTFTGSIPETTNIQKTSADTITDNTQLNGYDELSNDDSLERFTISEYNTDNDEVENIKRPNKSTIENSTFPTNKLFGIWVQDPGPDTPHATFQLTKESFFVVDYDGDGDMPYLIKNDSIIIYYNDFIQRGKIIDASSDQLKIHWKDSERPTIYYTWKN